MAPTAMVSRSWGKALHEVDEAHVFFAEQVFYGNLDVAEVEFGGVLGVHADFVQVAATFKTVHACLDDDEADAVCPFVGVCFGGDDDEVAEDAVGDEGFLAVDEIMVVAENGRCLYTCHVTPCIWFRHGNGGNLLTRD